jgi:hypothetical protein
MPSAEKDARRQFIIEAVTEALILSDAMTGNSEGTPSTYYVDPENVEYLVKTVLDFAESTAAQMGWTRVIPPEVTDAGGEA